MSLLKNNNNEKYKDIILHSFNIAIILSYRPVFLIPLLSVLIHSIIFYFTGKAFIINVDVLLCASFVWNAISWAHFVYFCTEKFCDK